MQTFVPYGDDFPRNATVLDRQRLGKQRVEGLQILRTLTGIKDGWKNHPAVRMWRGHEEALAHYTLAMCDEWKARGYKDTCTEQVLAMFPNLIPAHMVLTPNWLDDDDLIESHRSNLVRKLPDHYGALWPEVPLDLPYIWPV